MDTNNSSASPSPTTDDGSGDRWTKTFCPPVGAPVRAENQPGLRRPEVPCHDWPASDPLDHPDVED
jgi:hypothetical protein